MICCYDLFMAWFCCYDFDMVSVKILDVGQTCDLKPAHRNHIQNIPKLYQNHIKIVSKPYQNRIKKRIKIKIVSKSYQNHKNLRQIDQKPVPGLFLFLFFEANSLEPYKKSYQNHTKTVSKSYQNRIKTISKSYRNHNPKFKAYQIHIVKSYPKPY